MGATGLVIDPAFRLHETGSGHPESPRRLEAIETELQRRGLRQRCQLIRARPATDLELQRCHTVRYLETVRRDVAYDARQLSTGDTTICDASEDVARLAAGGTLAAVEAVLSGQVNHAFALVRPPGHHAEADRGMGFCIFNNVALGARHAQVVHGLERVLIIDWDLHHGNGTQAIFWRDSSVLFASVHEWGNYPGSGAATERGEGPGLGFTLNCPLPGGSDGPAVLTALTAVLRPAAERFRPQLVLVSAGFDSHRDDPLGSFRLEDSDYGALTQLCLDIASEHADGRLVSVLEGGYALQGLAGGAAAHVETLLASGSAPTGSGPA